MIPYWLLFALATLGAMVTVNDRAVIGGPKPMFALFGLFVALFVGLRYKVGADWETYVYLFDYASRVPFGKAIASGDYGYQIFSWLAGTQNLDIWAVNLACAAIFTWGLIRFCAMQPNRWVAIAIAIPYIVIVVAMGYTRQGTALGFVMAGLADYLKRERLLRFALYVLAGALFHSSAVVVFVLIGMTSKNSRFVNLLLVLAVAILFYRTFISNEMDRLDIIYLRTGYSSQGALIRIMLDVAAAIAFYAFGKHLQFGESERRIWRNFSIASLVALGSLAVVSSSTAVDRIAIYLMPLQIAVFTRVAVMSGMSSLIAVVGAFALVQFWWLNFAQHAQYWLPYRSFVFGGP